MSKDASSAAQNGGTETRTNRKSDTPNSSSVPQKASADTPSQHGELKSSPLSSDTKSASSKETEGSKAGSQPAASPKSAPKATAEDVETDDDMAPKPTVQSPHVNTVTEDTSFTESEKDSSSKGEKLEKTGGDDGEDEKKNGERESAVENSPR